MKRVVEKAKANPVATAIISILLASGGVGGANYQYLVDFATLPQRIKIIEARQQMDAIQRLRRGDITLDEFVEIMYPNMDSLKVLTGVSR